MQYQPNIEPLFSKLGWLGLITFAVLTLIVVPWMYLFIPDGGAFHISSYTVTLIGKIMCYCIVAVAMNLDNTPRPSAAYTVPANCPTPPSTTTMNESMMYA